jgi:heme exporter protein A
MPFWHRTLPASLSRGIFAAGRPRFILNDLLEPAELVRASGLVKRFGERRAVDRVDVELRAGECLAVLGPNGAGKSTLLRMMATLLRPDTGELAVCGHALPDEAGAARGAIGYLGHDPLVYLDLTARQNLELYADLYGLSDPRRLADDALDRVGLLARSFDLVRTFSRGMAQRLGLARVLMHEPRLLLLDEPYAGLDAAGAHLLDGVLADASAGRGVVIVTHEVERGVALAGRVLVLRAGRAVMAGPIGGVDGAAFRARYEELVA